MANPQSSTNSINGGFIVDDCFADDDLLTSEDFNEAPAFKKENDLHIEKSFLERDNFESEFGDTAGDPFGENFTDVANNEIIDLFCEGDLVARPIVVLYAYRLPSNKAFDHYKFLRYFQAVLDKIVDLDYTIIYFHYGLRSNNKPSLKWLIRAYQLLDRRYKKNLKALYLVHPSKFIRFIWNMFQPFISYKFERKIHYVNSLAELNLMVPNIYLNLPQPIIDYDHSLTNDTSLNNNQSIHNGVVPPRPTQQFNVPLKFILDHNPNFDIPPIAGELIEFLQEHGLMVKGIFRRSAPVHIIQKLQQRINMGERIDFINDSEFNGDLQHAAIIASVLLKTFLRSLGEPLITNHLYPELTLLTAIEKSHRLEAIRELLNKLPPENYLLLKRIIQFLTEVEKLSQENLMDANNLSIVFGPNLTWPTNQQVPMSQLNNLNSFCYVLIKNYDIIFC